MPKKGKVTYGESRIELEIPLKVSRKKAWHALTKQIGAWWPRECCINPKRLKAFRLECKPGGCMYEDWGNGDGAHWWTVSIFDSTRFTFSFSGNVGDWGIEVVRLTLEEKEGHTVLKVVNGIRGNQVWPKDHASQCEASWKHIIEGAFKPFVERSRR